MVVAIGNPSQGFECFGFERFFFWIRTFGFERFLDSNSNVNMADDEDPNDDDDGQNQQKHSIDIWIESQNLLKNSEILQHEHVYLNGYSTLVFVGSQFGVSFFLLSIQKWS